MMNKDKTSFAKWLVALALFLFGLTASFGAHAACSLTLSNIAVSPNPAAVGDGVQISVQIDYQGCQGNALQVTSSSQVLLNYAACAASGSDWNCASVSNSGGVTTSQFTPGNNGKKSSILTLSYSAASAGTTTFILTGNNGASTQSIGVTVIPAPIADYHFEESAWTGAANEVQDSSGNGNHAQAFNSANTIATSAAIVGNPGTCRYGVFDSGAAITKGYVQTPLPNLTTNFTVTGWIRSSNVSPKGQRILIDDQGNSGGYGFSLSDGVAGKLRFYSRGITPVILDSGYSIASNTWYFVAAVADITNKKRTIYVYDETGTLLNSSTEAAWTKGTWGTDNGPVSIGGETNASGELPASFHFRGNLDEIRVYGAALNRTALDAIATQTHPCTTNLLDHLVIESAGTGLTCAANTITVRACADAACTTLYTGGVSGAMTATAVPPDPLPTVNWDGTTGAGFVIPAGSSSVTKDVQVVTAGSVVFGISAPTPVPTSPTTCNFSPTCTFTANTAGFIFSNSAIGTAYAIPAQRAGIPVTGLYLRALQSSTSNPAVCTPAIVGQTTPVNLGYVCNNPSTCQSGSLATVNATAIAPAGSAVNLTFDGNGSAPVTLRYDDVGQITFNASKTVTPFGGGTAVMLTGNSNALVVAPHHFGFSAITAGPIKAGNNFSATVTAYNGLATPTATPNFGKEAKPEQVTISRVRYKPSASVAGTSDGLFSGAVGTFNLGAASTNNLNWSEVGIIDLSAVLTSASYLASGLSVFGSTGATGVIGSDGSVVRFIPDHFDTAVSPIAGVPMPCPAGLTCPSQYNGFVYSGQDVPLTITAKNGLSTPTTTVNYNYSATASESFSRSVTLAAVAAVGGSAIATTAPGGVVSAGAVPASSFSLGTTPAPAYPVFTFAATPTAPTDVYWRAIDSDSVASLRSTPASSIEGGIKVVSGRLKIANAYGSELLPLPMKVTAQYYSGTSWTTSTTDSVSTPGGTVNAAAVAGVTLCTGLGFVTTPPTVASGIGSLTLTKPTNGRCSADITLTAPGYLPSVGGRATFGIFGNTVSPLIYRRENY